MTLSAPWFSHQKFLHLKFLYRYTPPRYCPRHPGRDDGRAYGAGVYHEGAVDARLRPQRVSERAW
ncbi:MAG: hypothetical protein U5L04_08820 [Trueperaceae bacterium]|nr:hypothetical protein [Trueperaceae bacterium]